MALPVGPRNRRGSTRTRTARSKPGPVSLNRADGNARSFGDLKDRYKKALEAYLIQTDEDSLNAAYELGREALDPGIGLLRLVDLHGAAASEVIGDKAGETFARFRSANRFLLESLSVFEMMRISALDMHKALRRLNHMLEEEANRIGLFLHDDSVQLLATVYLELAEIERERPTRSITRHVDRIKTHLDQVSQQLRHISHELSPPMLHQFGLVPALVFLAEGIEKRLKLPIRIESDAASRGRFPSEIETALYRVVQEALNNVVRHAQASHAAVTVRTEGGTVCCTIVDDGIGFDPSAPENGCGLGLFGMRGRANGLRGKLQINSSPGAGTTVLATLPLETKPS